MNDPHAGSRAGDRLYRRGAVLGLTMAETFILVAFALLMLLLLWRSESEAYRDEAAALSDLSAAERDAIREVVLQGGLAWMRSFAEADLAMPLHGEETAFTEWLRLREDADVRRLVEAVAIWKGEERQRLVELVALEPDEQSLADLVAILEEGVTPEEIRQALAASSPTTGRMDISARIRSRLAALAEREALLVAATTAALGPVVVAAGGEIDETGAIVLPEDVLFEQGRADITPRLRDFLDRICLPWFEMLHGIGFGIEEILIEGHASSEWGDLPEDEAYFANLALSQNRAKAVLGECLRNVGSGEIGQWARRKATAAGYSSSRPVLNADGGEDAKRSRRVVFRATVATRDIMQGIGDDVGTEARSTETQALDFGKPGTVVTGMARVIDGDTLILGDERVRLIGIDAPEDGQICLTASGRPWSCGEAATIALEDLVGSRPVACESAGRDRFGRVLAVCRLDDRDINAFLVEEGLAVSYHRRSLYREEEARARADARGLWQGHFDLPWEWRAGHRSVGDLAEQLSFEEDDAIR